MISKMHGTTCADKASQSGFGTAFFVSCFYGNGCCWQKNLTAVAAKPIEATMTKTASSAGYELALLAVPLTFMIIPGAIMIYFFLNYIAQGFEMGRV